MSPSSPTLIWERKIDLLYLTFFGLHIITMLVVDLTPFYPAAVKPQFLSDIRGWYITTYKDRFFQNPPAWFTAYLVLEAVYHLPLSVWAIVAILRDDPLVPLNLLIWSVQVAITTLTCVIEAMSWEDVNGSEKIALAQLYVPYLALALGMGIDMFLRLKASLLFRKKPVKNGGKSVAFGENTKDH